MKHSILALALIATGTAAWATTPEQELAEGRRLAASLSQEGRDLCVFDNGAPSDVPHQTVRNLKVAKGTYGGVKELLPTLTQQALADNADAVVNYNSSQRFGFWPWRVVRPVITGTAIRWTERPRKSCEALGGVRMETILSSNRSPEELARNTPSADVAASQPTSTPQ